MQRFVTEELEAPFLDTAEAKKAATQTVFDTFPGLEERARQMVREKEAKVAAARAAAEAAEADDTPAPYPSPVDLPDDARGDGNAMRYRRVVW